MFVQYRFVQMVLHSLDSWRQTDDNVTKKDIRVGAPVLP